ncbi:MAG TPA: FUSC family protein [Edaphobacter sp.]|nr:FUSC family protein [Edaphobacter sp.]
MARIPKQDANALRPQTGEILIGAAVLAISCVISYWLITHILANTYSISRDDDLLGGMWAVAATIFVCRYSHAESVRAALSRMAATSVSFALCLIYLLIFPFHVWGMAVLIGIGAVIVTITGRSDDTITTGITIAVVMVVAALSPHAAWRQPILRLFDTAVGVSVGVVAAWVGSNLMRVSKLIGRTTPVLSEQRKES